MEIEVVCQKKLKTKNMEDRYHSDNRRNYIGIAFVAVGLFLILQKTGIIPWEIAHYVLRWQMVLIAIGVFAIVGGKNKTGGLIMITIGTLLYLPEILDISFHLRRLVWPAILVVVGVILISKQSGLSSGRTSRCCSKNTKGNPDYFDEIAIFGSAQPRVSTQNLQGGRVFAAFGGAEIDLTQANMGVNPCVVNIFVKFGGATFIVPSDWNVKIEVVSIFGGYSDKRNTNLEMQNSDKTLVIKGYVFFGGCEIKSYR